MNDMKHGRYLLQVLLSYVPYLGEIDLLDNPRKTKTKEDDNTKQGSIEIKKVVSTRLSRTCSESFSHHAPQHKQTSLTSFV